MRRIKIAVSLLFVAAIIVVLARASFAYPPLVAKARKFGAKDCTFCHVEPEGGPPWNERGTWLVKEKERRGADVVDVEWLADYKPGAEEDKKADDVKATDAAGQASASKAGADKPDVTNFDDFVGEYELPVFTLVVTREEDKLFAKAGGDTREELKLQPDGSFTVTNVNAKLRFIRNDNGKVIELLANLHGQEMKGKKIK